MVDTAQKVKEHLARWNNPSTDSFIERAVGEPVPEGDTRATSHQRAKELEHDHNAGLDSVDAARMYEDDGSTESDYSSMTNDELRAELEDRGLPKSGKKDELVARLEEDDEEA